MEASMAGPRIISLPEFVAALRTADRERIWNVLTDNYFTGELVPGSRWVPLDRIGREVTGRGLDRAGTIIVYCSGTSCPNSKDAGAKLVTLGFTDVLVFEGGLEAWKADGRGVEVLQPAA
jgi:rhodanese-related sulfurtransferase